MPYHHELTGSDLHDPKAHASNHVDGTDDIPNATSSQKGLMTAAQAGKLEVVSGDLVGTTDTQTLSNKTLSDPHISLDSSEGSAGDVLKSQGTGLPPIWGTVDAGIVDYQEFLSSGTWSKPSGAKLVYVEAIGGGGGGSNRIDAEWAGGGAGGEFISRLMRASEVGSTETVTVGVGGAGCPLNENRNGSTGGSSSFGSHVTARGGNPGTSDGHGGTIPGAIETQTTATVDYFILPQAGGGASFSSKGVNTIYGGAGGGSAGSNTTHDPGTSVFGGDGGAGSAISGDKAGDGSRPGGGGGGSSSVGGGGDGGDGIVRVWCW